MWGSFDPDQCDWMVYRFEKWCCLSAQQFGNIIVSNCQQELRRAHASSYDGRNSNKYRLKMAQVCFNPGLAFGIQIVVPKSLHTFSNSLH
jgi:hypothetical protein